MWLFCGSSAECVAWLALLATEKNGIFSQGFMHIISATKDMAVITCTFSYSACHISEPLGFPGVFSSPFRGLRH